MKIKYISSISSEDSPPFENIKGIRLTDDPYKADWIVYEARQARDLKSIPGIDCLIWWRGKGLPGEDILDKKEVLFTPDPGQLIYMLKQKMLQHSHHALNPLTGLPGNKAVFDELTKILRSENTLAVYLDLMDFKAYNEAYGFAAGDRVLFSFAGLLEEVITAIYGRGNYFLGHIGGDDFFASLPEVKINEFFEMLDKKFFILRESFYSAADKSRGSIIAFNRKGEREEFSLMGVCSVAFSPLRENTFSPERAAAFATYLKESAKSRRNADNVFITPREIDIIPGGLVKYSLDKKIPIARRRAAIEAMGQSGMAHYGKALINIYTETSEIMVKKSILYSLGRLRYLPARDLIKEELENENPHIRTRAVEALGAIGGAEEVEKIGNLLMDPNIHTAVMAAKALGLLGHPAGLTHLKKIPQNASRWLKMEAAHSRCMLKDFNAMKDLRQMMKNSSYIFRKKAALTLSFIKTPAALKIILKSFACESDGRVRRAQVVSALRICKNLSSKDLEKFSKPMWKMYKKSPKNLKPFFLGIMNRAKIKSFTHEAEKKMSSSSAELRQRVTEALAYSDKKKHRDYVSSRLEDIHAPVREKSARVLGESGRVENMEGLRKALKDREPRVRRAAAKSIIKLIRIKEEKKLKK